MERREQLLRIVSPFASAQESAVKYAQHLEELFDLLDAEKIGENYQNAIEQHAYAVAIAACAEYYRNKPDFATTELSGKGTYDLEGAERYIKGIAREINADWHFPNGEVDFLFDPTEGIGPRNHEWLWQFNRHSHWANLARAYTATGNEAYAGEFQKQLLRWIAQTDISEHWNGPGSAWRTIECGIRLLGNWQIAYDGFRASSSVDDVTLLLMIASMHRQAIHLAEHPTQKNWLMMESNGLYTFAALFTEFSDSEANRKIAVGRLLKELETQILPDGMHDELSPDYQFVVANCAFNFYSLALSLGKEKEIPLDFIELIKRTVDAAVYLSTPSFTQPRTNDTYTIHTECFTKRAEALLGENSTYRFVNSGRTEGTPPEGKTTSAFLPYAGFAVMRSDWRADASYLCFDVGPLGMGHEHQDKLNINLYKGNTELIYDDGGGQYEISPMRDYAKSAYGHNTVLVDGLPQYRKAPLRTEVPCDAVWITNDDFDYASAVYDDTFGKELKKPATHKREVRFCKPDLFCVADTLLSADGNLHDYEVLFHLDTTKVKLLSEYANAVLSDFGKDYEIAIIPLDDSADVSLHTVSGTAEPFPQGWYNGRNESNLHAAITVSRKVSAVKDFRFVTLLIPMKKDAPLPVVTRGADGITKVVMGEKEYRFHVDKLELDDMQME